MAPLLVPGDLLQLEEDRHLAELVYDYDFRHGRDFKNAIFSGYKSKIHHPSSSPAGAFYLLAVFRCYTFCLTASSLSLALHACLGGTPAGFHVDCVKDGHFRFVMASKLVGYAVADLKRIMTPQLDVYFHRRSDGGENWFRDLRK
jgi:hypothetical protein